MVFKYAVLCLLSLYVGSSAEDYSYVESYYDQKIDHFNFLAHGNETYKQRFLYNDTWWDQGSGPILFYAGNEGDILGFWKNSGFMFRAAKQFHALVVFAEHRYYGKSLPFGEKSFTGNNIGLMTIEQALADYAFFLKGFKKTLKAEKCPVVAFGGSYGGMLATYMRLKYPNIIIGAIAASAPIYIEKLSGNVFFQGVTESFHDASPECEATVRSAFNQLQKWSELGKKGYSEIAQTFYLCEPLRNAADYEYLLRWIRNAFLTAALMNYPYATQFMGNFPAYPVKVMCNRLQSAVRPADGLYAASALFYNATQDLPCFDIYNEYVYCSDPTGCGLGNDAIAWDYLACVEFNSEMETNGVTDMFPVLKFNSSMRDHHCLNTFNVVPRRDIMDVEYWGDDITPASNIVFSNGNMDPCAAGGVLQNISDSLVAVIVDGGAHHLDLREDNPLDPQSVRDARNFELANIEKWLRDYYHWNK